MAEVIKKNYQTIEEAFQTLTEEERNHAVRVGEYMQLLFLQACSEEVYPTDQKTRSRLNANYANVAYAIGKYHDLGKILVPLVYHKLSESYSSVETEVYKMHASDSSTLAYELLGKTGEFKSVELNYIKEAILSHHENYDGTGFPNGLSKSDISILSRLLKICNDLDNASVDLHDEYPIDVTLKKMANKKGSEYDPLLLDMAISNKGKIKRIFKSHIAQTKAIPVAKACLRKNKNRPFALWYRPITDRKSGKTISFEAVVRFKYKDDWQEFEDARYLLKREKLEPSLGLYMIYEAADMINRLDCCKIPCEYIALELPYAYFNKKGAAKEVLNALKDAEVAADRICIIYSPKSWFERSEKTSNENLKKLSEGGVRVMLSEIYTDLLPLENLKELGISEYRVGPDFFEGKDLDSVSNFLDKVKNLNINILTNAVYKKYLQLVLNKVNIPAECGPMSGNFDLEQSVIETGIALNE